MSERQSPTRNNISFRTRENVSLTYDLGTPTERRKVIPSGDYLWHDTTTEDHVYFIDEDGEVGCFASQSYESMSRAGLIRMTPDWVGQEWVTNNKEAHRRKGCTPEGDALARLKSG